jgi:protein-disulfide isomerase
MQRNTSPLWPMAIFAIAFVILGLVAFVLKDGQSEKKSLSISTFPAVTELDRVKGNMNAKVTLVEYSDFQCPACAAYAPLVAQLMKEHGDNLRLAYRHFPLPQHPNARVAAIAAEAAGRQGKFFEMHDMLFELQREWVSSVDPAVQFLTYAQVLGLDKVRFSADSVSQETRAKIDADFAAGRNLGIRGTPTFFLNGKLVANPRNYEEFKSLIENELNNS